MRDLYQAHQPLIKARFDAWMVQNPEPACLRDPDSITERRRLLDWQTRARSVWKDLWRVEGFGSILDEMHLEEIMPNSITRMQQLRQRLWNDPSLQAIDGGYLAHSMYVKILKKRLGDLSIWEWTWAVAHEQDLCGFSTRIGTIPVQSEDPLQDLCKARDPLGAHLRHVWYQNAQAEVLALGPGRWHYQAQANVLSCLTQQHALPTVFQDVFHHLRAHFAVAKTFAHPWSLQHAPIIEIPASAHERLKLLQTPVPSFEGIPCRA